MWYADGWWYYFNLGPHISNFFFQGSCLCLKRQKKEVGFRLFNFGGLWCFLSVFSVRIWLLGLLKNGLVYLDGSDVVKSAYSRDDILEARLHRLTASLPVEGDLLPVLCRCGRLCRLRARGSLCLPPRLVRFLLPLLAGQGMRATALVLENTAGVVLVGLAVAAVACLSLDVPEGGLQGPGARQLCGDGHGGCGGRGGHLRGGHGMRVCVDGA